VLPFAFVVHQVELGIAVRLAYKHDPFSIGRVNRRHVVTLAKRQPFFCVAIIGGNRKEFVVSGSKAFFGISEDDLISYLYTQATGSNGGSNDVKEVKASRP
jgi:hypothetical protein